MVSFICDYFFFLYSHSIVLNSINHEYKEWDDKNPQLVTCNKDTKNLPPRGTPQEVEADKEIIFTYDVSFKVPYNPRLLHFFIYFLYLCTYGPTPTFSPRKVKSNGHLVGTHTFL